MPRHFEHMTKYDMFTIHEKHPLTLNKHENKRKCLETIMPTEQVACIDKI